MILGNAVEEGSGLVIFVGERFERIAKEADKITSRLKQLILVIRQEILSF